MIDARREHLRNSSGFTLVELLVVIGIIALLLSILIPTLGRSRDVANNVKCKSNLNQISTALRMYANANKDHYPDPLAIGDAASNEYGWPFRRGVNEVDPVNPALRETRGLHNLLHGTLLGEKGPAYLTSPAVWICPSMGGANSTQTTKNSYAWNVTKTTSRMGSGKRAKMPLDSAGAPAPKNWWYVQDAVFYDVRATDSSWQPSNPLIPPPVRLGSWYMPHSTGAKQRTGLTNTDRSGSTNVAFLDGPVGSFVYTTRSGTSPAEVLRGQ